MYIYIYIERERERGRDCWKQNQLFIKKIGKVFAMSDNVWLNNNPFGLYIPQEMIKYLYYIKENYAYCTNLRRTSI